MKKFMEKIMKSASTETYDPSPLMFVSRIPYRYSPEL